MELSGFHLKKAPDYEKSRNQLPVAKKQALRRTASRVNALSCGACRAFWRA
jgi:predicted RNase H-like nuclease